MTEGLFYLILSVGVTPIIKHPVYSNIKEVHTARMYDSAIKVSFLLL